MRQPWNGQGVGGAQHAERVLEAYAMRARARA